MNAARDVPVRPGDDPRYGARRGPRRAVPWLDLAGLTFVWLLMVWLVDPVGDFPINDDWVYAAAVRTLVETGRFELYSFSSANVGPMAYWGALFAHLFGFSFTALRFSTLILGLVGGFAVYFLFLEVWKDRVGAIVLALATLAEPIYFSQSNTFMTDVPFFAAVAVSMVLIARGFERERSGWLVAGLLVAVLTVLMRQFAVIVLFGFAFAFVASRGLSPKNVVIAVAPLAIGLLMNTLFTHWLADTGRKPVGAGIPSLVPELTARYFWYAKATLFSALSYTGFFLIPFAAMFLPVPATAFRKDRRTVTWVAVVVTTLVLGYAFHARRLTMPTGENILSAFGIGPLTNGDTLMQRQNLPHESWLVHAAWIAVTVLTIVTAACLIVAIAAGLRTSFRSWRAPLHTAARKRLVLTLFFAGSAAAYLGILTLLSNGFTVLDRYMLPLILFGGLVLPNLQQEAKRSGVSERRRSAIAVPLIALSAIFSVVATHDFLRWSATRWDALQVLRTEGISPHRIDGGYEFNGWYLYDRRYVAAPPKNWWWVDGDDYLTASGPVPGYHVLRRYPVDRWWNNGAGDVFILER